MSKRIKATDIRKKLNEQNFRCAYTGDELTPKNVSADHLAPISRGGSHALDNIRLVTMEVNAAKGTLSLDEFVALCRKVVAHFDRQGELDADQDQEETVLEEAEARCRETTDQAAEETTSATGCT
jgi:5-methylcytosine-specific restriction endonuclease McrA